MRAPPLAGPWSPGTLSSSESPENAALGLVSPPFPPPGRAQTSLDPLAHMLPPCPSFCALDTHNRTVRKRGYFPPALPGRLKRSCPGRPPHSESTLDGTSIPLHSVCTHLGRALPGDEGYAPALSLLSLLQGGPPGGGARFVELNEHI